jgi:hypothetical protein
MKKTNASINLTINGDTPLVTVKHTTDNLNNLYDTIIEKLKILITMVEESTKVPAMKPSQVYGYRGES